MDKQTMAYALVFLIVVIAGIYFASTNCGCEGYRPMYDIYRDAHHCGSDVKTDVIHSPCYDCGGDYSSVSGKRDRYFQINQGNMGDGITYGYPFYKAY